MEQEVEEIEVSETEVEETEVKEMEVTETEAQEDEFLEAALAEIEEDAAVDEWDESGVTRSPAELVAVVEALVFVADEPVSTKMLADVLKEEKGAIEAAIEQLQADYESRDSGLQIREIAGGWQLSTRTELHEEVRKFLKTRPSAKLSLASLETLAVIAYKQPVTVPEILEIRGVQSASAIKTLLDKHLIVAKGRKEAVGRPIQYGTSKEFLVQFGLKDLSELPSIEDFEDLSQGL
jgi:segregation and condensation protein B